MGFKVLPISRPRKRQRSLAFVLKKIWSDPVWSKIISAGILALIGVFATYFLGYWEKIKNTCIWLLEFFNQVVTIPLWLVVVVVVVISILALLAAIPMVIRLLPDPSPRFTKYVQDSFWGVDWHWNWIGPYRDNPKYRLGSLVPRCPDCKSHLQINYEYHARNQILTCINTTCRWKWVMPSLPITGPFNYNELLKRVQTEIDRKIYTDEFRV
jgi:uncharacterized membrane protein